MISRINLIFVTFLGVGYIKFAPGTFASLFASILFFCLFNYFISITSFYFLCIFMLIIFIYSLYAIKNVENKFEKKDANQIVIDEVIGQSIPIFLIEYVVYLQSQSFGSDFYLYLLSFLLFRFFDILKPFQISYFDKNFKNSFGVLFDDVLAGIYSLSIVLLVIKFF